MHSILDTSQSQWPCSLRHVFMAAHFLGLWVWILLVYGCLSFVSVVCGLAEVSATSWSLIQRNPTKFGVSDCDHEASTMKRPWPTRGCHAMERKTLDTNSSCRAAVSWIPFCNVNMVNHEEGALNSPYILKALWRTVASGAHMGPEIEDAPSADIWLHHWSVAGSTFCVLNYILTQFQVPAPLWHTNFISLFFLCFLYC